jgi:hypothetical protein
MRAYIRYLAQLAVILGLFSALQPSFVSAVEVFGVGAASVTTCNGDLTSATSELDAIQMAVQDRGLRQRILARRRFHGDVLFEVPEFRPVIRQMLAELNLLRARMKASSYHGVFRIPIVLSFKAKSADLTARLNQMLRSPPRYWDVLEASSDFASLADTVLNMEGQMDGSNSYHGRDVGTYLKVAQAIAAAGPILFIPTFHEISVREINRVWGAGIAPVGLVTQMVRADGTSFGARTFINHDIQHAQLMRGDLARAINADERLRTGSTHKELVLTVQEQQAMDEVMARHFRILSIFERKVEAIADKDLQRAVEWGFFGVDHEVGLFEGRGSLHNIDREGFYGELFMIRDYIDDPASGFPQTPAYWSGVVGPWIARYWALSEVEAGLRE